MALRPITILGTGAALPDTVLSSAELDRRYGKPMGWFERRTGVRSRHVCGKERASDLATAAARGALAAANLRPQDVDAVISATAVPEQPIPAMAPLVQANLGLGKTGTPAFDVNATCLSFLTAFDLAAAWIEAGRARRILIVSSEVASRALPWDDDPETAAMFGDGAAAAVIGKNEVGANSGLAAVAMRTYSDGYRDCELAAGGTRFDFRAERNAFEANATFRMNGPAVYRLSAEVVPPFIDELLRGAGWLIGDLDCIVPHQASRLGLDHMVKRLGLAREKVVDILASHANQIASSLPSALHWAVASGRLKRGDKVLMAGTSAGLSVGGMALVY
jgi:3-oxoacyl-[acyl-carrier-protein] synthase-3